MTIPAAGRDRWWSRGQPELMGYLNPDCWCLIGYNQRGDKMVLGRCATLDEAQERQRIYSDVYHDMEIIPPKGGR